MNKIFIIILLSIFFVGVMSGCSSPYKKNLDKMIGDKIENIEAKDLPQLIVSQKINYFLFPLFLSLFVSIVLIVSGVRAIGFSILLASITCIVLIITMAVYLKLIAIVGICVLIAGIYILGKNIYNKTLSQRDLVSSVEISKRYISDVSKKKLKIALDKTQSSYTKAIVKEIKS